jgi:hypothetical protein
MGRWSRLRLLRGRTGPNLPPTEKSTTGKTIVMKRKRQSRSKGSKAANKELGRSGKQGPHDGDLEKALSLIRTHPGLRPSELNRLLNRAESDSLRSTLIKRGLIRKEKDGAAMRYYAVQRGSI